MQRYLTTAISLSLLGSAALAAPFCEAPHFGSRISNLTSSNQNSRYLRFGDLDGDGDLDAVTGQQGVASSACNCFPGEVSVLLNDGRGLFSAPVTYEETDFLNGLELADFDDDGDLDVVVGSTRSDQFWIYSNDGTSGLTRIGIYFLSRPSGFAVADFDGDGDSDLLVRYSPPTPGSDPRFRVYESSGSGTFSPAFDFANPLGGNAVLGDVDGDAILDAVVHATGSGTVGVYYGRGDGTFEAGPLTAVTPYPKEVALGDLNGDSFLDAAVVSLEPSTASILLGRGDGTFEAEVVYPVGDQPLSVAIADVDGDGDLDVATADSGLGLPAFDPSMSILINDGSGSFAPSVQHDAGPQPGSIQLADLDGDGDADAGVVRREGFGFLDTIPNNGDGTFGPKGPVQAGVGGAGVLAAELDDDGALEWVVVNSSDGDVSVFENDGNGDPTGRTDYPIGGQNGPRGAALADLDRDGVLDLVVSEFLASAVVVLPGAGDATFGSGVQYLSGVRPTGIVAADFDRDGWIDVATANRDGNDVTVLANAGDGSLLAPASWPVATGPEDLTAGDLNGDAAPDLVVASYDRGFGSTVSVLSNTGDGSFAVTTLPNSGQGPRAVALGDPDADGDLDIAVANDESNEVRVFWNDGSGSFSAPQILPGLFGARDVAWEDVDADGLDDLLVAAGDSSFVFAELAVLLSEGGGSFALPFFYRPDWEIGTLAVADVTGDGGPDVTVLTNIDSLSVLVATCAVSDLFLDGFESGDTSAWSRTTPRSWRPAVRGRVPHTMH